MDSPSSDIQKQKFTMVKEKDAEGEQETGITLPVYFKDECIHMIIYDSQPIHQVKEIWKIKRPLVDFQNYEIVLCFKDNKLEILPDNTEVDLEQLLEAECIRIIQAGYHHNIAAHPEATLLKNITLKN